MYQKTDYNAKGRIETITILKDGSILKSEHLSDPPKGYCECEFLYTLNDVEISLEEYSMLLKPSK